MENSVPGKAASITEKKVYGSTIRNGHKILSEIKPPYINKNHTKNT